MRERGADGLSFDIIVAAGPNGAMPHHHPTDRPLQAGEPIVIDMGARLGGYCSDLTRTFVLGEPDERFWEVYTTVLRAQQTCEMGLKAGLSGVEADALAREVIEAAGYGDQFGHGTGHGVGLAIHEAPRLSPIALGRSVSGRLCRHGGAGDLSARLGRRADRRYGRSGCRTASKCSLAPISSRTCRWSSMTGLPPASDNAPSPQVERGPGVRSTKAKTEEGAARRDHCRRATARRRHRA